jgi:hypothetical protein
VWKNEGLKLKNFTLIYCKLINMINLYVKQPTCCLQSWQAQQPKRGQFGHPHQEDDMACNSTCGPSMFDHLDLSTTISSKKYVQHLHSMLLMLFVICMHNLSIWIWKLDANNHFFEWWHNVIYLNVGLPNYPYHWHYTLEQNYLLLTCPKTHLKVIQINYDHHIASYWS